MKLPNKSQFKTILFVIICHMLSYYSLAMEDFDFAEESQIGANDLQDSTSTLQKEANKIYKILSASSDIWSSGTKVLLKQSLNEQIAFYEEAIALYQKIEKIPNMKTPCEISYIYYLISKCILCSFDLAIINFKYNEDGSLADDICLINELNARLKNPTMKNFIKYANQIGIVFVSRNDEIGKSPKRILKNFLEKKCVRFVALQNNLKSMIKYNIFQPAYLKTNYINITTFNLFKKIFKQTLISTFIEELDRNLYPKEKLHCSYLQLKASKLISSEKCEEKFSDTLKKLCKEEREQIKQDKKISKSKKENILTKSVESKDNHDAKKIMMSHRYSPVCQKRIISLSNINVSYDDAIHV